MCGRFVGSLGGQGFAVNIVIVDVGDTGAIWRNFGVENGTAVGDGCELTGSAVEDPAGIEGIMIAMDGFCKKQDLLVVVGELVVEGLGAPGSAGMCRFR